MFAPLLFYFLCCLKMGFMFPSREELILQEPSMWPGHLEPFGSNQVASKIDEVDTWPDPVTFFKMYVDKLKPVLFKGLAKQSPAYAKFDDDYFKNAPGADKTMIYAEPEIKENRTKEGYTISIKEFIERYHNETIYMVDALPLQYASDVLMPVPLRCESTQDLMVSQVIWFSSGGTKSVLHNDDVDNINCLFRGSKELWFIEYDKNKEFVSLFEEGTYSPIDVEKVNYTAFPELRKVDMYYRAVMEEGDCVFIPYNWLHQVNSFANKDNMNLAVNVWFTHEVGHVPEKCTITQSEATIDKYRFPDDEKNKQGDDSLAIFGNLKGYLKEKEVISIEFFLKMLKKEELFNPTSHKFDGYPEEFKVPVSKIFELLDSNKDSKLTQEDVTAFAKLDEEKYTALEKALFNQAHAIRKYFLEQSKLSNNNSESVVTPERIKDEF